LAGSYLKSLQLAKQLEERAKEATKYRELAEKESESLQGFLKVCRENDVDLSEVDHVLAEFNASMEGRDYQTALGHAKKSQEAAKSAYIRRIGDVADSVDAILTLMQPQGKETKGALDMLEKSKELVVRDDLEGAMKYAKNSYDAAERGLHEHFSELLSQAQDIINQAKEMGDDVGIFEDQMSRAKTALEQQEYESSIAQLKEAIDGAGENVRSQIEQAIAKAEDLKTAGVELGADMTRITNHIERAHKSLEALRFKESLSYAKRAEADGENVISSKFQEFVRDTRDGIKKLRSVNEDAEVPQQMLDQAVSAMKDKKYVEALRALTVAKEKTQGIQFQSVLEVIAKARDKFVLAKKVGVDMTKAIMLLNTARDTLRLGKLEDAISYAMQSQTEVDAALGVFYQARDQLGALAKAIKFTADLGGDVVPIKDVLAQTKKLFEDHNYQEATDRAKEGLELARKNGHDKTMDTIDLADRAFKLGKMVGADVAEAEGLLQRALASISEEDLPEGLKLAKMSLEAANAGITRVLSDRITSLDTFVKGYSGEADLSEVAALIEQARVNVASLEFERTHETLKEVTKKIETSGMEESERLLASAAQKIDSMSAMGVDSSDLQILMTRARSALEQKVFEDASARAKDLISQAEEMMFKAVQAEFSAVKDPIEEANAIGIDVDDTKLPLKEARAKSEEKNFAEAHRILTETKDSLMAKIARYDKIKADILRAEELIAEAGRSKADTSALSRKLEAAKNTFASGDLEDADRMLAGLLEEIERNLAMYLAAKFILSSKEIIDLAQAHGIDASTAQDLLARTKDLMKKKRYEEALAGAKQCDEQARRTVTDSVNDMIKDLQRLLTDAKNVGVDTLGPEKLAEKASELARSGNLIEALKCIESAKDDIDHVKNLSAQAAVEIRIARGNLKDAETLDMEVGRARELLEQAVDALTRHQYAIALELARKSSEASSEVTRSRIRDTLDKLKGRIEKASSEGAPLGMAERYVAEGLQAFNEERYKDSLKLAMKCEGEMERAELQREVGTRAVETARAKYEEALIQGTKNQRVADLVRKAESYLAEGKFVEALTASIESGDELHLMGENLDSARIEFSSVKEQVDRLKKVKIDTVECDEMLDMAQEYISSHEFGRCREALRRCSAKAVTLFESSIKDVVNQNTEMISRAKSMGINTKACEDLLEVANTSFSEKLWDFAFQQAEACRTACLDMIGKKMNSLIGDVRGRLDTLARLGASVRPVEEMIEEARQASEAGDSGVAFQIMMNADQKILAMEDAHKKYTDISIAAESAIEILRRFGISSRESERLLALADIEKEKDYDSAIEFVAEALDTAKTLIESYSPDITGTISTAGLQEGAEGVVMVRLKNVGKALAKDVQMEIGGDFEVVEVSATDMLRPNSEEELTAKIIPKRTGSIPIRANITVKRQSDGKLQAFEIEGTVTAFAPGLPFKLSRASEMTKCVSCHGRIKPGFDIVACRCGNQLHLACAKRVGQCPACGQKYSF
jgi:hypothetical protein